jgi:predicted Holliday junction resolvase-like endonuclease
MNRKQIIKDLKASSEIKAHCPYCDEEFTLSKAVLFDASAELPQAATDIIADRTRHLKDRAIHIRQEKAELRRRKHSATFGAEKKAMEVTLGLVLEKIVTGWTGFPHAPHDCRSLFEPIDYVAFDGLTEKAGVEKVAFLDVKSGDAKLNKHQRLVRDAINEGRVDYREV